MLNIITERRLDMSYADNGKVVENMKQAITLLKSKQYIKVDNNIWKNKIGKIARIYKLRDSILNSKTGEVIAYKPLGILVSFGGDPITHTRCIYS